jgi:hypothetical protein
MLESDQLEVETVSTVLPGFTFTVSKLKDRRAGWDALRPGYACLSAVGVRSVRSVLLVCLVAACGPTPPPSSSSDPPTPPGGCSVMECGPQRVTEIHPKCADGSNGRDRCIRDAGECKWVHECPQTPAK